MRLGGRLAASIEILGDMGTRHRPAADALRDWGLSHRFAGSADRAAIGNIVYDALRRRRSAAWLMDSETPLALALGALLLEGGASPDTILAELADDRFTPPEIDRNAFAAAADRTLADAPEGVRADCPEWCEPFLQEAFGDDWAGEGAALAARPPLDMRVNTLKADRQKVLNALARAGARQCRLAPQGMRIEATAGFGRHPNVQAEPAFQKGWFEVQDEGSQLVSRLTGAKPGMQVLDFCAGAGGKTLALSAAMENKGQIFAHDADRQRLAPIFDRLKRAGCRNVQVVPDRADLQAREGLMDIVLVDAPCTGSGTWRRRPDAKWRLTAQQLEARQIEQDAILDLASRHVKPGGQLAYVTCSVFRQENAERIAGFLSRNAAFSPVDHRTLWHEAFPDGGEGARVDAFAGLSLSPARTGTDGFYFCALRRAS